MGVLSNLEPKEVFKNFEALSMIPRSTFHCQYIGEFLIQFAKNHDLEWSKDEVGNVYIWKPGTTGYEDCKPVIMQGHMDMVATADYGYGHNFDTEPLDLFIEGDYIGARGTTLGADDGIALAYTMAILESTDIPHPPIEAVFTVDEEIGMGGAHGLQTDWLDGRMLMNIDGETDDAFIVGCAGAYVAEIHMPFERTPYEGTAVQVAVRGLQGGHSGNDIQLQRGNANKILGRVLYMLSKKFDFVIDTIEGGSGANVITMFSTANVVVNSKQVEAFVDETARLSSMIFAEFFGAEPDFRLVAMAEEAGTYNAMDAESTKKIIATVYGAIDGVQTYDRVIPGAVESSLNAGMLIQHDDKVIMRFQIRGSVDSKLTEMLDRLELWCNWVGVDFVIESSYPAWAFQPESKIRDVMVEAYRKVMGKEPELQNVHAGLECGIIMGKCPDMDMITFGPNMLDVHTSGERLQISSTAKIWELIKTSLKACRF